ncbi:MAG: hypothetical protein II399_07205, partial [Lachnospiraceae bacterium]|nr:hypothetical protein [Lachnospiraceae bacterium]
RKIANTDTTGQGMCTFPEFYEPTNINDDCMMEPRPYTCKDCERFGCDFGCATCNPDDPVDTEDSDGKKHRCLGFEDKYQTAVIEAICKWAARGEDVDKNLAECIEAARVFTDRLKERNKPQNREILPEGEFVLIEDTESDGVPF